MTPNQLLLYWGQVPIYIVTHVTDVRLIGAAGGGVNMVGQT